VLTAPDALSLYWVGYLPDVYAGARPDIQIYGESNVLKNNIVDELDELLSN